MPENEEEKQLEAFEANFTQGLNDLLENAEILLDIPRPIDPSSMGFDERTMEDLTSAEKKVVVKVIYQKLGLDPNNLELSKLREYKTRQKNPNTPSQDDINIIVFRTNQASIVLQELVNPDGEKRWVIGPDQDI
ncbi:hypothetical protein A2617_04340 [Candidatus Daviesbacteria bacterium RIFOXYD1_FULL_41_10]|uniref:Uncharacterized protein n=2 Tax=Candidatus Daviesiibacteriota TaxID=1752718 RepID=A0A1F5N0I5_9BACT|nr:MAG: hypothetical protein UU67_C0020G0011 [Candidatus Daviesbacteria bacterium GW2011_GWB1_41_5]OGE71128.1 MAG: hypothetical protein A2617_04340 [Candidatus Daviesbacteria bacterium RIFOXYD1_FULL_41_10]